MKLIAFQRRKTLHLRRQRSHTETSRPPTENPLPPSTDTNDRVIEIRYRGDKSCAVKVGLDMRKKCFVRTSQNLQD